MSGFIPEKRSSRIQGVPSDNYQSLPKAHTPISAQGHKNNPMFSPKGFNPNPPQKSADKYQYFNTLIENNN